MSPAQAQISSGLLQGQALWLHQPWEAQGGISPLGGGHHYPYHRTSASNTGIADSRDWVTSGQTTNREGAQPHPSAENWIKELLNMALPTRGRPSFPNSLSLPSGSLCKPLIHQRADRRNIIPWPPEQKLQSQKTNQNNHMDHRLV